jgi:hypothetical protein
MGARPPRQMAARERAARMRGRANAVLAILAGSLVAAIIGLVLGRSAIGEINPIYFQPVEPVRAVDPNPPQAQDSFAQAYGWENGQAARAADCGADCAGDPGAYAFADPPATRSGGPYWRDDSPTTELPPWPPGQVSPRRDTIERYSHYPIEEGPVGAGALKVAPEESEAAEDEPAGGK